MCFGNDQERRAKSLEGRVIQLARSGGQASVFPHFFPIPDAVRRGMEKAIAELVSQHHDLPAVMGLRYEKWRARPRLRSWSPELFSAIKLREFAGREDTRRDQEHALAGLVHTKQFIMFAFCSQSITTGVKSQV